MATGTATIDFGAFPGKADATVAVTGQTSIATGSLVEAWIRPVATADHSIDEHVVEKIRLVARDIVAGTGFTIHALEDSPTSVERRGPRGEDIGNEGHRLYGQWTVNWAWV